jgi:hypothetical protein
VRRQRSIDEIIVTPTEEIDYYWIKTSVRETTCVFISPGCNESTVHTRRFGSSSPTLVDGRSHDQSRSNHNIDPVCGDELVVASFTEHDLQDFVCREMNVVPLRWESFPAVCACFGHVPFSGTDPTETILIAVCLWFLRCGSRWLLVTVSSDDESNRCTQPRRSQQGILLLQ